MRRGDRELCDSAPCVAAILGNAVIRAAVAIRLRNGRIQGGKERTGRFPYAIAPLSGVGVRRIGEPCNQQPLSAKREDPRVPVVEPCVVHDCRDRPRFAAVVAAGETGFAKRTDVTAAEAGIGGIQGAVLILTNGRPAAIAEKGIGVPVHDPIGFLRVFFHGLLLFIVVNWHTDRRISLRWSARARCRGT